MRGVVLLALAYGLAMRAAELALSRRNGARVVARGGRRVEADGFGALAGVHGLWFLGLALEEAWLGPTLNGVALTGGILTGGGLGGGVWCTAAAVVFVASELARFWCIATLGERWNVRVVVLDGAPRVERGPYRFLAHPNYLAATVGVAALPLALGLVWTAALVLPLKIAAVWRRIRIEERALGLVE